MHIVVVEDDAGAQTMLAKSLTQWQHTVIPAASGRQALEVIATAHIDMIITKRLLPDINGVELCQKVRALKMNHSIFILLVVAQESLLDQTVGSFSAADDLIVAPFNQDRLRFKTVIAERMSRLERELNQNFLAIKKNYFQTIYLLLQLLGTYDAKTAAHCRRVGNLALLMAKRHPGVPTDDYPVIEACGSLHDIGFIGLPQPVLNRRRTEISGEHLDLYRSHSLRGESILAQLDLLRPVSKLVRMHHEQYNGRGFPDGLAADQIPLAARIVSAASVYDDLVHLEKAALARVPEYLQQHRGYQLEPALVDLLLEINLNKLQEEERRDDCDVTISELTPGMVLAGDVLMKSGAFLMAADTRLDAGHIQKLKRYHELGNIIEKVYIRK
ncbi:MAG: response regulator [Desulfobacteraceae bacterium]|nr:MAG: response regulator [Desulfobacteraceae bacterium]